ncbi:MAG: protein kinase, partial [Chloroflexi bacterium]|nr:protein kinase [Chloroflexota bacterium]
MEDLVGRDLGGGRYHLLALVGRGGMAAVYEAEHTRLRRHIAVKVLDPAYTIRSDIVQRFHREAETIARLDHPHILSVYDSGEEDNLLYVVMPLVRGGSLKSRLKGSDPAPWPVQPVLQLAHQVLVALDYAHQHGVIHRDIKPDNILLEGNRAFLVDFGIAKVLEDDPGLTLVGTFVGTPEYASPEQVLALDLDGRSDLYAFGVVLYELLVGRVPYRGDAPIGVALQHVQGHLPAPREINPTLPEPLAQVLVKMLRTERNDRYATGAEVESALIGAVHQSGHLPAPSSEMVGGESLDPVSLPLPQTLSSDPGQLPAAAWTTSASPAEPSQSVEGNTDVTELDTGLPDMGYDADLSRGSTRQPPELRASESEVAPARTTAGDDDVRQREGALPTTGRRRSGRLLALGASLLLATIAAVLYLANPRTQGQGSAVTPVPTEGTGAIIAATLTIGSTPTVGSAPTLQSAPAIATSGPEVQIAQPEIALAPTTQPPQTGTSVIALTLPPNPQTTPSAVPTPGVAALVPAVAAQATAAAPTSESARATTSVIASTPVPTVEPSPMPTPNLLTPVSSMREARYAHTTTPLADGRVLAVGGRANQASLRTAEEFDPLTNTWSSVTLMSTPRAHQTATLLANGQVLVIGGQDSETSYLASAELFDPASDHWRRVSPMSTPRADHSAVLLHDGRVLVAGGVNSSGYLASAELYDPVADRWSPVASMAHFRSQHTATVLPDSQVLVVGGFGAESAAERFDPASDTWSDITDMSEGRIGHSATLLGDGSVLVAGGSNSTHGGTYLATSERYDPANATWSQAGTMSAARTGHSATLLPDGEVLVIGGRDGAGALANADRYDPGANSWAGTVDATVARWLHTAALLGN